MNRIILEEKIDIPIGRSDYKIIKEVTKRYPYKFYLCKLKDRFCGISNNLRGKNIEELEGNLVFNLSSDLIIICKEIMKDDDSSCLIIDLKESDLSININVLDGGALAVMGSYFYPCNCIGVYSYEQVKELMNLFCEGECRDRIGYDKKLD